MVWWRTDNGGRTWSQLPPTSLPPQAVALPLYADTACPEFSSPHIAFASADVGWWTYGACGEGAARPLVWSTRDGGLNWIPSPLPAPSGGWGRWDVLDQGGTDVGTPYLISSRAGTTIIVPVSVGTSRLVIELSLDMGRTWHIASVVDTHALPIQSTPADWFDPVNAFDWVVAAPGGLIATTNAGETWTLTRSPVALSGQPVSFTSPDTGFVQAPVSSSPCARATEALRGTRSQRPSLVRYRRHGRWATSSRQSKLSVPIWPLQQARPAHDL